MIGAGAIMVALTLVDVKRRTADQTVLEARANPSGLRPVSLVVFLGLFFAWAFAEWPIKVRGSHWTAVGGHLGGRTTLHPDGDALWRRRQWTKPGCCRCPVG